MISIILFSFSSPYRWPTGNGVSGMQGACSICYDGALAVIMSVVSISFSCLLQKYAFYLKRPSKSRAFCISSSSYRWSMGRQTRFSASWCSQTPGLHHSSTLGQ